ncbi:MAG TPA: LamG domain-containing protein [Nannocystaceae bacterium]|nr:LamG domain-containing protein [Nannocystaceae bacterium]
MRGSVRWVGVLAACGCFVDPPLLDSEDSDASAPGETSSAAPLGSSGDAEAEAEASTAAPTSASDGGDDGSTGAAIDCAPTPAGMVAWWRGDGDMIDAVGGEAASAVGGVEANAEGYVAEAFHFDGVDDALSVGHSEAPTASFTVEAWLRLDDLEQPPASAVTVVGDMEIVGKMAVGDAPNADGWRLFKQTDADELWFCVGAIDNGCRADSPNTVRTPSAAVGEWLHVAAVKEGERIAIHLDGTLVAESTLVDPVDTSLAAVSIGASTADVTDETNGYTAFFYGRIDEVALYDRALSDSEVSALASATEGKCRS